MLQFPLDDDEERKRLQFLLDEGLELLAAFRRIPDPARRAQILEMVEEEADAVRPNHHEHEKRL